MPTLRLANIMHRATWAPVCGYPSTAHLFQVVGRRAIAKPMQQPGQDSAVLASHGSGFVRRETASTHGVLLIARLPCDAYLPDHHRLPQTPIVVGSSESEWTSGNVPVAAEAADGHVQSLCTDAQTDFLAEPITLSAWSIAPCRYCWPRLSASSTHLK